MTRMLIHGAGGFVGGALLDHLTEADVDELILTDSRPVETWTNQTTGPPGIPTTVVQTEKLCGLDLPAPDTLVALAGQTNVDEGLADPRKSFQSNIDIAIDLAEWLLGHSGTQLIYLSSDETLGTSFTPLDEQARLAPSQPYATSKATSEMILNCYRETYGLKITIVRSCNLVGLQSGAQKLIPTAVEHLSAGQPVPVFGDGEYVREWLAVEDLCEALRLLAKGEVGHTLYHCSSGTHLNVREVIELVAEGLGVTAEWCFVADRLVHDRCYAMNSTRLRAYGWSPKHDVREAIRLAAKKLAGR